MTQRAALTATITIVVCLLAEHPVHGYIDPGSQSVFYQALLGSLLAVGFVLRRVMRSVTRWLRQVAGRPDSSASMTDSSGS